MRRWRVLTAAALAFMLAMSLTGTPAAAAPAGGQVLPFDKYFAAVADHARNRVFVTGGWGSNSVVVLDYQGHITGQIQNMPNAGGMTIVGNRMYVTREYDTAIDVVDLGTLSRVRTIRLPYEASGAVAYVAGQLWTSSKPCVYYDTKAQPGLGELMATNPATGRTRLAGPGGSCPLYRTSPLHPNWFFTADTGSSAGSVHAYDVSLGFPRHGEVFQPPSSQGNVDDFAVSADGRHVFVARRVADGVAEFRVSDGAQSRTYPTGGELLFAVATTDAGGGYVAAGLGGFVDRVRFFRPGSGTVVKTHDPAEAVAVQGLLFVPDAGAIFVFSDPWNEAAKVHTFDAPFGEVVPITLTASRNTVTTGESAVLTGQVALGASSNRTVALYAQPHARRSRRVATATADSAGRFRFSVVPSRNTTYVAHWTGDAGHVAVTSAPRTVQLRVISKLRSYGGYKRDGEYRYFRLDRRAPLVAEVLPHQPRRPLLFRVQRRRDGAWRGFERAVLQIPRDGTLEAAFITTRTGRYRIRTEFDDLHVLGDVSPWRYLRFTR